MFEDRKVLCVPKEKAWTLTWLHQNGIWGVVADEIGEVTEDRRATAISLEATGGTGFDLEEKLE